MRSRLSWPDRCLSGLRPQVNSCRRPHLGRRLRGDRRLLSRRLRRNRVRRRQSGDQHRLHGCCRAGLGMGDGTLCPCTSRKAVITLLIKNKMATGSRGQFTSSRSVSIETEPGDLLQRCHHALRRSEWRWPPQAQLRSGRSTHWTIDAKPRH